MFPANVCVIDLGVANYGSMLNMLKKVGARAVLSSKVTDIEAATHIILPGVGSFDAVSKALFARSDVVYAMQTQVIEKQTPFMGVCVGMQLLFSNSEEGVEPGLGWIEGDVRRFENNNTEKRLLIPHMGWNIAKPLMESPIFEIDDQYKFYFVHSFRATNVPLANKLCSTNYGGEFVSAVNRENIYGFQFHPEKSHKYGVNLFSKFIGL
jgi:glutamine amidotransferase